MKKIVLCGILLLFWLVLSPVITLEALAVGTLVCLAVVFFSNELIFNRDEFPLYSFKSCINLFLFLLHLIKEIFVANIQVAKIVLSPSMPIQPCFFKVPTKIKKDISKVIYGNSVTLTPGTLTVDIEDDGFIIHALTNEAAKGMEESFIEKWVTRIEGGKK